MAKNFLTQEQEEKLTKLKWKVNPTGNFVVMYRDELPKKVWDNLCRVTGTDNSKEFLKLLTFGTYQK